MSKKYKLKLTNNEFNWLFIILMRESYFFMIHHEGHNSELLENFFNKVRSLDK